MTKPAKTPKLCNMTYTGDDGSQRLCQDGNARPAVRQRLGARICAECWPAVQDKLVEEYGKGHEALAYSQIPKLFKVI